MIKIRIITVGKIKEKEMNSIIKEYEKRLSGLCAFESIVIDDCPVKDNPSEADIEKVLKTEAEKIDSKLNGRNLTVAMCIEGKKLTSEALASFISQSSMNYPGIDFVIGSSHGIHESIKKKAGLKLSMSDMTFPHNLARLMLTEQLYRAFKINSGASYHK